MLQAGFPAGFRPADCFPLWRLSAPGDGWSPLSGAQGDPLPFWEQTGPPGAGPGSVHSSAPPPPRGLPQLRLWGCGSWEPGSARPAGWKAQDPVPGPLPGSSANFAFVGSGPGLCRSLPRGREDKIASRTAEPGGARAAGRGRGAGAPLSPGPGPGLPRPRPPEGTRERGRSGARVEHSCFF